MYALHASIELVRFPYLCLQHYRIAQPFALAVSLSILLSFAALTKRNSYGEYACTSWQLRDSP